MYIYTYINVFVKYVDESRKCISLFESMYMNRKYISSFLGLHWSFDLI
jgi:hypothetical protein